MKNHSIQFRLWWTPFEIKLCTIEIISKHYIMWNNTGPVKVCPHVHNYEQEQAPMVTDLRRRPVMGFFTVALRPGESTDGQLSRDWAPPFCDGVSFRNVLGREYTQSPRSTPYSQWYCIAWWRTVLLLLLIMHSRYTADEHVGRTVGLIQEWHCRCNSVRSCSDC